MECQECRFFKSHCEFLLSRKGSESECDWKPSRFKPIEARALNGKYSYREMEKRVAEMNKGGLLLSNQYGMVFILNQNNEILLCVSDLISKEERMKHS